MTRVPSTDVLRLQVADDPSGLVNLVVNPSGELGGWGWVTPVAGTAMSGDADGGGLTYYSTATGAQVFQTEDMLITAALYAASSWRLITSALPPSSGLWVRNDVQWINAAGAVISTTTPSPWMDTSLTANRGHTQLYGPNQAPVGTVKFRLRFAFAKDASGTALTAQPFSMTFDQATVATAATSGELGTMSVNLVPDPDVEANPLTTWLASGPNVLVARDTSQHWHGAASAKVSSITTSVRTNQVTNPNFEHGSSAGWQGETSHSILTVDSGVPGASGTAALKIAGDGTQEWVQAELTKARFIPCSPDQTLACRARFRFGNPGGSWDQTVVTLGIRWTNATGDYIDGTTIYSVRTLVEPSSAQGNWLNITGTITVPARAHGARLALAFQDQNTVGVNQAAWIDNIMVELAGSSSLSLGYVDGDLADTSTVRYDWGGTVGDSTSFQTTAAATTTSPGVVTSTQFAIRPGRPYTVSAAVRAASGSPGAMFSARLDWYDIDHNPLTPASTFVQLGTADSSGWLRLDHTITTPASAAFATVAVYPGSIPPTAGYYIDAVQVEPGEDMGPFIIGQVTTGGLPYIPPVSWVDIIGATHDITVSRQSLNIGTMTATVLDANLDPSRSTLIRPGRACRLMAYGWGGSDWSPVFTGTIAQAEVTYDPQTPAPKRAKVVLSAVDALARLANIARGEGVGTIHDLPYVLEGCGVPWDVNGSGNQVPTATVVARNDSSSALDQVAITRDSALGIAWLDRLGTLHIYDDSDMWVGVVTTLDEDRYSDIDISFNTSAVINEVNLAYQRYNPSTGDTDEIPYGPYVDADSVAEWGAFSADFRVQGIHEDSTTLAAYAQAILDANSTPVRRINSITVPIKTTRDIAIDRALLDLENLTGVHNLAADLLGNLRIQSIEHHITTTTWVVMFGFGVDGQVASPTFTPAPGNTGGQTLDQLLRPVGEVTMFYGAKSAIPSGWLPLDGTTFSAVTYPALAALLGGTTLPSMADRVPIGAGTKALGTTGGQASVSLTIGQMPAHTHQVVRGPAVGTADSVARGSTTAANQPTDSTGSGNAIDITPLYRSLWFIIRAR